MYETVGQIFFARREWNLIDWALTACSNYYYGDELLLFVLCRLFQRHALVICREQNWSTLEPEGTMTTEQLLDACDLHLIYLRPGIFGELTLKKGKSMSMLTSSPPEFPAWSSDMVQGNILDMPGLEGFVDSELLKTYLNINEGETLEATATNSSMKEVNISTDDEETIVSNLDNSFAVNDGNADVDMNSGNDVSTMKSGNELLSVNDSIDIDHDIGNNKPTTKGGNGSIIVLNLDNSFAMNGGNADVDVNSGNDGSTMKSGNESLSLNDDMNSGNNELRTKGGNGLIIPNRGSITTVTSGNNEPIQTGENSVSTIAYEDYDDEWSHIMDNHPEVMDIEVASPVSLKTSATQVLSMAMRVNKPMTLMHCCVDVISWNTGMTFPGNLTIPHLLFTRTKTAELRRMDPPLIPHHTIKQVSLYDNINIDKEARNLWLSDVQKRKYVVMIPKLSQKDIDLLCNKQPSWMGIDPYSDLEDRGDTSQDKEPIVPNEPNPYSLRKCEGTGPLRTRPTRAACSDVKYSEFYNDLDLPPSPKAKTKPRPKTQGPSDERIVARGKQSVPPSQTHPISVIESRKAETSDSEVTMRDDNTDSDTTIILEKVDKQSQQETPVKADHIPKKEKSVFKTTRVGLKKFRRKRSYKCPVCGKRYAMQCELNSHYRETHKNVKCSKCNMSFTMPSTLTWHYYTHAEPRKFCRCGKGFYFSSELRVHKLTHRRIKTQMCIHPGCGKSYFSASDLAKHAHIHENISWNCDKCDYSTPDKRLLRSHQRVHERVSRYTCAKCGDTFIFHTQWARHNRKDQC